MVFSCILLVSASAETPLEKVEPYLAAKESVHEQRMAKIEAKVEEENAELRKKYLRHLGELKKVAQFKLQDADLAILLKKEIELTEVENEAEGFDPADAGIREEYRKAKDTFLDGLKDWQDKGKAQEEKERKRFFDELEAEEKSQLAKGQLEVSALIKKRLRELKGEEPGDPAAVAEAVEPMEPQGPPADYTNSLKMDFKRVADVSALVGMYEVTRAQYGAFARATKRDWSVPSFGEDKAELEQHPAVHVSWKDATEFVDWLNKKEAAALRRRKFLGYRLPMDREWSRAAGLAAEDGADPEQRNLGVKAYYWGEGFPPAGFANLPDDAFKAKYPDQVSLPKYVDELAETAPVGSFGANDNGLFDMCGNVSEWVLDPRKKDAGQHVLRGANWQVLGDKTDLQISRRLFELPAKRSEAYGFRLVLVRK